MTNVLGCRAAKLAATPTLSSPRAEPPAAALLRHYSRAHVEALYSDTDRSALIETYEIVTDVERPIRLLDRYLVQTGFFEAVESNFCAIYPHLLPDADYTPQDLYGDARWCALPEHEQRLVVICLRHLASIDDVPLVEVSYARSGPILFRIPATVEAEGRRRRCRSAPVHPHLESTGIRNGARRPTSTRPMRFKK